MGSSHATTVLGVRHQGKVVFGSDGQVTLGQTILKHQARKVRRIYHDRVLAGFAGSAADGFALSAASRASWRSIGATSSGRLSSLLVTGGPTAPFAGSRR